MSGYYFSTRVLLRVFSNALEVLALMAKICSISIILAIALGTLLALARRSSFKPLSALSAAYIAFIRATPLLVQIYFVFYAAPRLGIILSTNVCGILILVLHNAGYMAEIIRAGIESISENQSEAADSLGLKYSQKMRYVIFPQAFRNILPPLTGQVSYLVKDSALLSVIGVTELTKFARVTQMRTFRPVESYIPTVLFYLVIILTILYISKFIEMRWRGAR